MKLTTITLSTLGLVATTVLARPQVTGLPLMPCVSSCLDDIVANGTCTSAIDIPCVCGAKSLQPCILQNCPPSFVDPAAQYCAAIASESLSSGIFTIQTDTTAGASSSPVSLTRTTTIPATTSTGVFSPSGIQSPVSTLSSLIASVTGSSSASATTTAAAANMGERRFNTAALPMVALAMAAALVGGALIV